MLIKISKALSKFSYLTGYLAALLLILLLFNVAYDVLMRYIFNDVSIGMQELEWHLYASVFLLGLSYTLETGGHVRVDIVYHQLDPKKQAFINIFGTMIFLIPFASLIAYYGLGFAYNSYSINEISGDPGGLTHRWLIKSMISVSFLCLLISSFSFMLRSYLAYKQPMIAK